MPRVPTKATVIAINDDDEEEEKSYDDHMKTSQHIIVTAEQFENIPIRKGRKSEDALFFQVNFSLNSKKEVFSISEIRLNTIMKNRIGLIIYQNRIPFLILFKWIFLLFNLMINIHLLNKHFSLIFIIAVQNLFQRIFLLLFILHLSMLQITSQQLIHLISIPIYHHH
jgi:hypothetical protein